MFGKLFSFSNLTLLVALGLSSIAAWYSIIGLTAIFAGAVIPIIIMGSALELAKITTTVWLRKYWDYCGWLLKMYLVPAVFLLAVLTSMGIFGFLSKAHTDQNLVSGDVGAKIVLIDEKIKIERDNIANYKQVIKQMDDAVNGVMATGDQEFKRKDGSTFVRSAAERSLQIRRQQQKDRDRLTKDIETAQNKIVKLQEEAAPIRASMRQVEAEVGPIKYVAALIYGDNPDQNLLERSVRWVIILLVAVFDPLALMLVIAANQSKEWDNKEDEKEVKEWDNVPSLSEDFFDEPTEPVIEKEPEIVVDPEDTRTMLEKHPYLTKPFVHFKNLKPIVGQEESKYEQDDGPLTEDQIEQIKESVKEPLIVTNSNPEDNVPLADSSNESLEDTTGDMVIDGQVISKRDYPHLKPTSNPEYFMFYGKRTHLNVVSNAHPELFVSIRQPKVTFGSSFPNDPKVSDICIRVDINPNKVFKFNGLQWLEQNKGASDAYLDNEEYLKHLVEKLSTGEYDPELLTPSEQDAVKSYIKTH